MAMIVECQGTLKFLGLTSYYRSFVLNYDAFTFCLRSSEKGHGHTTYVSFAQFLHSFHCASETGLGVVHS